MSRIDDLIAELCPDGVAFSQLSSVATANTGQQLNKTLMSDSGKYAVLNGGIGHSGRFDEFNTEGETIAISQGGASAGYVNFVNERFWAGAHCYVVAPKSNIVLNTFRSSSGMMARLRMST